MKRVITFAAILAVLLFCFLTFGNSAATSSSPTPPLASSASYDISWWTVDGGGVTSSTGGGYTLDSTIGQPDAGVMANGGYTLAGGFWGGGALAIQNNTYLPLVLR